MKSHRNRQDARSLRSRAGRADSIRETHFELLEERKLLFSLTITPGMDFDGDGLGSTSATFGYTLPVLDSAAEVQEGDPTDVTEDFNDEPPGPVPNRRIFTDSDIRTTHSFGFSQNYRIAPPDVDANERYLQINASDGSFWMFEPMVVDTDTGLPLYNISAVQVNFTISDPDGRGLLPNDFAVDLMFFDEVLGTFTGSDLIAQNQSGNSQDRQGGIGTFVFNAADADASAFTAIRFRSTTSEDLQLDDLAFFTSPGLFVDIVQERIVGAEVSFTAPVGATVQILDLYGRDMVQTLRLGTPDQFDLTLVDLDDDGVPNFNDGIGQIRFSGVDSRATFTMFGGTIDTDDQSPGGFAFTRVDNFIGLYDDFEAAGFGYYVEYDDSGQPTVFGLPGGPGSVVVGSPFVRDNSNGGTYAAAGRAGDSNIVSEDFNRPDQGVFVPGGESIGSVYIHGVVHGSSRFSGAVNELYFGYLVGSVSVEGDVGTMYVGSDAGFWISDDEATTDVRTTTGAQFTVGRTLGEVAIGGRSDLNVTVVGDLNNPALRPPDDSFRYAERERIFAFTESDNPEATIIGGVIFPIDDFFADASRVFISPAGRSPIFNTSTLRNDTLLGAEFVGSISSAAMVSGTLGYGDPVNGEDGVDIFAFAVDGTQDVGIQVTAGAPGLVRVFDQNGRPLAATELQQIALDPESFSISQSIRFRPPQAGVYYVEVSDVGVALSDGTNESGWGYVLTLAGLAPVALGSYRTAGASGAVAIPSVQALSGDIGMLRVGTAYTGPDGTDQDPSTIMNRPGDEEAEDAIDLLGTSFAAAGDLYAFVAGSDIRFGDLYVGGDLGAMYVGMSPVFALTGDGTNGDVYGLRMQIGGRIGLIDIKGAVGINQDPDPDGYILGIGADIRTGLVSGDGSIGMIRIGGDVNGGTLLINTSPGSVIGALLVSQDAGDAARGIHNSFLLGSDINLGFGSDLRFADVPRIDILNNADHSFTLFTGQSVEFVDDGGGIVRVEIQGPVRGIPAGVVRVIPVDNGQGVAIARIDSADGTGIDLTGGRTLRITGVGRTGGSNRDTPISIGQIDIAAGDAQSAVLIDGQVEIDVWRINSAVAIDRIANLTPGGDIVAIDAAGLNVVDVLHGNLGRTQPVEFGPQNFGPFLGIALGEQGGVGAALGVPAEVIAPINGLIGDFRPLGTIDGVYLDDIGAPLDPYLNGVVVRTGDLASVTVSGSIGDVILQGAGTIQEVMADSDAMPAADGFDGIFGNIYAQNIDRVDVGQGLRSSARAPFVSSGIFASDEIRTIVADATRHEGAFLAGVIVAADLTNDPNPSGDPEVGGIADILVSSGEIRNAYIGSMLLDAFLTSYVVGEGTIYAGTIRNIGGVDLTLFRSVIEASFLTNLSLGAGIYDATVTTIGTDIGQIEIATARNSTLTGGDYEFSFNIITAGENIGTFTAGDVSDLHVEAVGRVTGSVDSDNWRRVEFVVNGSVPSITLNDVMVSSQISVGRLGELSANAIRTSRVLVSGELTSVEAETEIFNSEFSVTGPQGEIGSITGATRVTGSVSASGPIGSVTATEGDLDLTVVTTTDFGAVGELVAGRDLILDTSISAGVGALQAGRNIGVPNGAGLIFVQGTLETLVASGHLYTDVRVGETLVAATIGAAVNRPGAPMARSGSIYAARRVEAVDITGDFGGSIVSYTDGIGLVSLTNGSLLRSGSIRSYDGDIESLVITGGNLYGDLFSDRSINSVVIDPSPDGVFGDVGVNPGLSAGVGYDSLRGQLPPGTLPTSGKDGPTISANLGIDSFVVSGGSVYEATFFAGRTIDSIQITGSVRSDTTPQNTGRTVFAAGDSISNITVTGAMDLGQVIAGMRSLGADMAPGGFGINADTTQAGSITGITVGGDMTNTQVTAGMNSGSDRQYNTADDRLEIGYSSVAAVSIGGVATGSSVFSDTLLAGAQAGGKLAWGGSFKPVNNGDIATGTTGTKLTAGSTFSFSTPAGTGTILFTGPGSAFFDAATSRVILHKTTLSSTLIVHANGDHRLTDFDIVSTEGASMGRIRVEAYRLLGDSDIVIDENVGRFELGGLYGSGDVLAGTSITAFVGGTFASGTLTTGHAESVSLSGEFGDADPDVRGEAMMSFVTAGSARFAGAMRGALSARYSIDAVTMNAALDNGLIRAGEALGVVTAASITESRISSGNSLAGLNVAGDVFDTSVMIGGDLGDDAEVSGSGFDADTVTAGFVGPITIGGDLVISDIVAGYLRGPDGFFGTSDDLLASGRSSIESVDVAGQILGSNRGSESYRIASTGTLGEVTDAGGTAGNDQNLVIEARPLDPLPLQIKAVDVRREGRLYVADLVFNQPVDISSLDRALSVSEVRGSGEIEIRLIHTVDYTLDYNAAENTVSVLFDPAITERDLPILSDNPGPGVYRFEIESDYVRGTASLAELDGDGNGRVDATDDFGGQNIIGDAGDKFGTNVFVVGGQNGFPEHRVDMYAPLSLDLVLDDAHQPDGLADANVEFTLRGAIGDHPDNDANYFSYSSDADVYSITLQAGQILRLGAMHGPAEFAGRFIIQPDGNFLSGSTDYALVLPFEPITSDNRDLTSPADYLIRRTGTFYLVVSNTFNLNQGALPDLDPVPGGVGEYSFSLRIFDDGDTGFNATTDAGNGQDLVNAPAPSAFAGNDGVLGTGDDQTSIVIGAYTFTFNAGPDGAAGTADDYVSGSNGDNVSSMTNALGAKLVSVDAAIGDPGFEGVPGNFFPDIDVFHLNGGNTVKTGSVVRATLKLSDLGSDLGSRAGSLQDAFPLDHYVQFAVFDTTNSTASDDALLLLSPSDSSPTGGATGVIAESEGAAYGYDENGDFYIEFVAPGRMDLPGKDASYAVYVQGVINSDYRLEIVTSGSRELVKRRQNIVIETNGGSVDWLEIGGVTTQIGAFLPGSLGFTGLAHNGQKIGDYIFDSVVGLMQQTFDSVVVGAGDDGKFGTADDQRGLDINVSTNPADFEFQDYSTIFLSSNLDPVNPIFRVGAGGLAEIGTQAYGVSQHADPGNADRNDEAVLFMPGFSILGYTPSADDLETFIQSLAAGANRRVGELMGLRLTQEYDPTLDLFDVMAVNSVPDTPGDTGSYEFLQSSRRLSPSSDALHDSDFFLGYQNAAGLLSLYTRDG